MLALVVEETVTGMTGEFVTFCNIPGDFAISFNRFSTWLSLIGGSELRLNSASTGGPGFGLRLVSASLRTRPRTRSRKTRSWPTLVRFISRITRDYTQR